MEKKEIEVKHGKLIYFSNGFGRFIDDFMSMAFGAYVFFFYETEIKLNVWLVGIAYMLYAIYDALDDPLIGYLTDRPFKFTKRWGRRFPWIVTGGILWILLYALLFAPPTYDPIGGAWLLFLWIIFSACLYDTFVTLYTVNFYALFPDKFRSIEERRVAAGLGITVSIFGVVLGSIVPPLFIKFGDIQSYLIQAAGVIIVCFIALLLSIPGIRDDQVHVDSYLKKYEKGWEREPFFKTMKIQIKQKNFVAYFVAFVLYQSLTACMIASMPYLVRYVLRMQADAVTLLMGGFLIGALASIPVWLFIERKVNDNRKTIILAGAIMTTFTAPLIFINEYVFFIIALIFWGFGLGGFWILLDPVLGDVIDEQVVRTGKRSEGIAYGVRTFFSRFSLVAQALTFSIVHTITGFNGNVEIQSPTAILGIHFHLALIPMIFILLATLILWKFYDLTAEKVKRNKEKLGEMGL